MSSLDLSLDSPAITDYTFITPGGRYTLPAAAIEYSPTLHQLVSFFPDVSEFNMVEMLKIEAAKEVTDSDGSVMKLPAHTLYGIPENYYELVFAFLNQLHLDRGVIPNMPRARGIDEKFPVGTEEREALDKELRDELQKGVTNPFPRQCTAFDPTSSNVLPQNYWKLVSAWAEAPTLENVGKFDLVALNFGNYTLTKLNELAGAFWIAKHTEEEMAANKHWVSHIIDRDEKIKEVTRQRNEVKRLEAAKEADAAKAATAEQESKEDVE